MTQSQCNGRGPIKRGQSRPLAPLLAGLFLCTLLPARILSAGTEEPAPLAGSGPDAGAALAPTVVLLSWDGLRHDALERTDLPALARIAQQGARAERLISVWPSDTFPSHVSLATGTYPDRHGIVGNHFIDRQAGAYHMSSQTRWLQAEPLWIAAERQGVPTATYFWVGSEQDWRGQGTRYRVAPFDGARPEQDKVDQILQWLQLPEDQRPRLIMSYWRGVDSVSHRFGPNSARVTQQLQQQDKVLGQLLEGLDRLARWQSLTLMLVSDHGMTATGDYVPLRETLAAAGIEAQVVGSAIAQVFLDDSSQRSAARVAIAALPEPLQIVDGARLPAHWRLQHPTRTGDLVVAAPPPYVLSRPQGFAGLLFRVLRTFGWDYGGHGYDPQLPDMGASLLALGRGVAAGQQLPAVHSVDVAATVAGLLGIEPPAQSEGSTIVLGGQLAP